MTVIKKLLGGGDSWWYLINEDTGKILGASHEDDAIKMKKFLESVNRDAAVAPVHPCPQI